MAYSIPNLWWKKLTLSTVQYFFEDLNHQKKHLDIFSQAKVLLFYAGELYFDLYEDRSFLDAITKSIESGCIVKALYGPAMYVNSGNFSKLARKTGKIELYKRSYRDPAHFKIIMDQKDNMFAIVDRPHNIGVGNKNRKRSALLINGYGHEIKLFVRKFNDELAKSKRIDIDRLVDEFSKREKVGDEFHGFIKKVNDDVVLAEDRDIEEFKKVLFSD